MTVKAGAWAAGVCVLAAAIGTGLYWKYGGGGNKGGWAMAPAKVAVAPAVQADFPVSLSGIGSLEATRQVQVPAEVDGRVAQILFNPGESARAGQLLVQLNDAPEQGELARLQAQVKNARAQLDRSRRLLPLQAATREQLDQAQADYDQAQGDLRRVQAQIEQKRIKAPFDGVLGVRRVNLGQFARAGDPLVSLTNTSTMYANLTLPEQALGALRPGQSVRVTVDAHPGRAFTGKVTTIEPQVDPGTRTVRVQATLDNADGALAAGMYAQGQVNLPARPGVITVPETAVSYSAYGNFGLCGESGAGGQGPDGAPGLRQDRRAHAGPRGRQRRLAGRRPRRYVGPVAPAQRRGGRAERAGHGGAGRRRAGPGRGSGPVARRPT